MAACSFVGLADVFGLDVGVVEYFVSPLPLLFGTALWVEGLIWLLLDELILL
jgi:hypothetical protein